MSTISVPGLEFLGFLHNNGSTNRRKFQNNSASWPIKMMKKKELCLWVKQCEALKPSGHELDEFQSPIQDHEDDKSSNELEQFVVQLATLDDHYFAAIWLRAQIEFEDQTDSRFVDSLMKKFIEQEFTAIKRRCKGTIGPKCICVIAVRKEEKNVKRAAVESVIGTLDLTIRKWKYGETFPEEQVRSRMFHEHRTDSVEYYGYVANVCVLKCARRQGVASRMISFAVESAKANGAGSVYMHVDRSNKGAQQLYHKLGFQMVEEASLQLEKRGSYLLCLKMVHREFERL